jgi:hypothetical protein
MVKTIPIFTRTFVTDDSLEAVEVIGRRLMRRNCTIHD